MFSQAVKNKPKNKSKPKDNQSKSKVAFKNMHANSKDTKPKPEQGAQSEMTMSTLLVNRRASAQNDVRTNKKVGLQSKPIIRDLSRRIKNYSVQYTPEYFKEIFEFLVEKESVETMSPTIDKINKWRSSRADEFKIQSQVSEQVKRIRQIITTSREKQCEEIKEKDQKKIIDPFRAQNVVKKQSCSNIQSSLNFKPETKGSEEWDNLSLGKQLAPLRKLKWEGKQDQFTMLVDYLISLLDDAVHPTSVFPACYLFYTLIVSDQRAFSSLARQRTNRIGLYSSFGELGGEMRSKYAEIIQYYMLVAIFISSKYNEIYPMSIYEFIDTINPSLTYDKVLKYEAVALSMLDFKEFYSDNQLKFLRIFNVIANWTESQLIVCQFILESGLNSPYLYQYPPQYKAAVVVWIFEERFLNSSQNFTGIRNLFPGFTISLATQIKNEYLTILMYNHKNDFSSQKKKYQIFNSEMGKILRTSIKQIKQAREEEEQTSPNN